MNIIFYQKNSIAPLVEEYESLDAQYKVHIAESVTFLGYNDKTFNHEVLSIWPNSTKQDRAELKTHIINTIKYADMGIVQKSKSVNL